MTFQQLVKNYLVENGMFESQADEVFKALVASEQLMAGRWNDKVSDYPEVIKNLTLLSTKRKAAEWIAENAPHAWYRPMFEN